jgi:hypothetical protein
VLKQDGAALDSITNVVFMGMGEPFHNLQPVLSAVDIMCHPLGLHMSHNKVGNGSVLVRCSAHGELPLCVRTGGASLTSVDKLGWLLCYNSHCAMSPCYAIVAAACGSVLEADRLVHPVWHNGLAWWSF